MKKRLNTLLELLAVYSFLLLVGYWVYLNFQMLFEMVLILPLLICYAGGIYENITKK